MKLTLYEARYEFQAKASDDYIDGRGLVASNLPERDIWSKFMDSNTKARHLTLRQVGSIVLDRRKVSPRFWDLPGERIELYLS